MLSHNAIKRISDIHVKMLPGDSCPKCGSVRTSHIPTTYNPTRSSLVTRSRVCDSCEHTFQTTEINSEVLDELLAIVNRFRAFAVGTSEVSNSPFFDDLESQ